MRSPVSFLMLAIILVSLAPAAAAGNIPIGQPFILTPGEEVDVGNMPLLVRFDEVLMDSRCPIDVTCFWEGEAATQLTLSAPDVEGEAVELHTPLSPLGSSSAEFLQHVITLRALNPYPDTTQPTDPEDYRLELIVELVSRVPAEPSTWSTLKASFR